MDMNVEDLLSSYEQFSGENKRVSIKDFTTPVHGEKGSAYCTGYCKRCVSNGAKYVTKNGFIREFLINLPLINNYVTDYGFELDKKPLVLPSGRTKVKEQIKLLTEKPLSDQLEEKIVFKVDNLKNTLDRAWRELNER